MKNPLKNLGPGTLVAAAFIGPGTVTVCTLAGVHYSFTLLWAMVLSVFATIVLQEMAARLGLVSGHGLAAVVKNQLRNPVLKAAAIVLMLAAILIGNAAYEAGNISGGVLGLETLFNHFTLDNNTASINLWSVFIGIIAFVLLYIGNYKLIEKALVALVIVMSLSFIVAAIVTNPNLSDVLKGLFVPQMPEESVLTIIALVGTTVVPYNLFLHASLVKEKWNGVADLKIARKDLYVSIILGGFVSIAIIICAAAVQQSEIKNAADLARGLEPLFGSYAKYLLSLGLCAAGITSAITAPLAAAYVAKGCFDWKAGLKDTKFRLVWITILVLGVVFSSVGFSSIEIIRFAQVANGVLLPIIAIFLLWVMNKKGVLGAYVNTRTQNVFGVVIIATTVVLSARTLLKVFGYL